MGLKIKKSILMKGRINMKKILALALTLVMIFALAVPAASAANDGSVYWLNFKPELDETAQALAAKYTEATGVEVKVVTAASGTYQQTLTSEMDKKAAPTLFVPIFTPF